MEKYRDRISERLEEERLEKRRQEQLKDMEYEENYRESVRRWKENGWTEEQVLQVKDCMGP